jgi:hypothetical protein
MKLHPRLSSAFRASFFHLLASSLVAALTAILVFQVWYAWPLDEMVGGRALFMLVVSVDVVCGPLLTLVLWNPAKPRRELIQDLTIVAIVQMGMLAYGVNTVAAARPVHLVFETDRFQVVTAAEIEPADLPAAPEGLRQLPWTGPTLISIRAPRSNEEFVKSLDLSMAGQEPALRPGWWQDYALALPKVQQRAKPLSALDKLPPAKKLELDKAVNTAAIPASELLWLPLTHRRAMDWIVLLDKKTGQPRAYAHIDGFF